MSTRPTNHILIRTKLNHPAADSQWVQRPRLIARLNESLKKRLTLICAPAGFGKTTLAVQWLKKRDRTHAWLSLNKRDADPDRFLKYFIAAVRTVFPEFGPKIHSLLSSPTLPPPDDLADAMVYDLDAFKEPVMLVLDDFQTISSDAVHKFLAWMVEHLPDNLHLIIITRVEPPWPIGRWRARQWLKEVRAAHLGFTEEETRVFFSKYTLTAETVRILHDRTEGWAAGLQLVRLSLADAQNPELFIRRLSGGHRSIIDYMTDEVISHQPPEVLDFLAATAMLGRFCAPLCDHLLADRDPQPAAREILARLERENLFLVPLDTQRQWYRYHHLFRDMLLHHLAELSPREHRAAVDRRAAEWFTREGLIEEALRHWIDAGDLDAAADLVGKAFRAAIDEDLSRRLLAHCLAMFPGGPEKGRRLLPCALLGRPPDVPYVRRLLDALEGQMNAETEKAAVEPLFGELTNREFDVLTQLAKRLTNKEIAELLFISPETVKRHAANIYFKMNVSGRRQAVAEAHKLGLLPGK
jgi:LuxR family maltose regulon positive regulatory protein